MEYVLHHHRIGRTSWIIPSYSIAPTSIENRSPSNSSIWHPTPGKKGKLLSLMAQYTLILSSANLTKQVLSAAKRVVCKYAYPIFPKLRLHVVQCGTLFFLGWLRLPHAIAGDVETDILALSLSIQNSTVLQCSPNTYRQFAPTWETLKIQRVRIFLSIVDTSRQDKICRPFEARCA
jgi:hypothetical protein